MTPPSPLLIGVDIWRPPQGYVDKTISPKIRDLFSGENMIFKRNKEQMFSDQLINFKNCICITLTEIAKICQRLQAFDPLSSSLTSVDI